MSTLLIILFIVLLLISTLSGSVRFHEKYHDSGVVPLTDVPLTHVDAKPWAMNPQYVDETNTTHNDTPQKVVVESEGLDVFTNAYAVEQPIVEKNVEHVIPYDVEEYSSFATLA